ncbi:hypothetical protein CHH91_07340 [Virgibacillus sp. 7505]|uniref:hypothetical protein n=1 Tax=Virgibacillus sp. 7505 TaxID=2022548 RepID=UPI000BA6BE43|nr:hypothetical protein [Virgibacillus sp. 7505]PAE17044.1 hypothetical protein CHH91_07340 [Virgibacillus sp. 7505]
MNLLPKTKIQLDHLGQFYAAVHSENNPGTFSVSAHLKDPLIPKTLQQAVNDLMQRLPFLNVGLKSGFMWHYHEVLAIPPKIVSENDFPPLCSSFKMSSNHLIRVIYGERYFTVEVLHTVCDGRSLAMVVSSLLARYSELLGERVIKERLVNCNETMHLEEAEDAYVKYADLRKTKFEDDKDAYIPKYQPVATRIMTHKFKLTHIKAKAKTKNLTITEFIMAHICNEFAIQRRKDGSNNKITVNVPIDCRGFFPSKSLRNFVTHKAITMAESLSFTDMAQDLKRQFADITPDFIQSKVSEMERLMRIGKCIPLFVKNSMIKKIGENEGAGYTTGFSNLGLIRLPKEIEEKIESLSFALGPEPNMPYQFSCVAVGDTLSLSVTTTAKDTEIIDRIINDL